MVVYVSKQCNADTQNVNEPRQNHTYIQISQHSTERMESGNDFSREMHRLATFSGWSPHASTVNNACPMILARLGFIYAGRDDSVVCCHCQTEVRGWSTSDDVKRKHGSCLQHFDRSDKIASIFSTVCQRLPASRKAGSSSVTTVESNGDVRDSAHSAPNDTTSIIVKSHSPFYEVCEASLSRASRKNFCDIYNRAAASASESVRADIVIDRTQPNFELLKVESARLVTFHDWPEPAARIVDPHDLARAGMFYTGQIDRVQCAFCRGCLHSWVQGDNPAEEHRKNFPSCLFMRDAADVGTFDIVDHVRPPHQV